MNREVSNPNSSYLCYDWHTDKPHDALHRYFLSPAELRYKPTVSHSATTIDAAWNLIWRMSKCPARVMNHISEQSGSLLMCHSFFHLLWSMSWIFPTEPPSLPLGKEDDGLDFLSETHTFAQADKDTGTHSWNTCKPAECWHTLWNPMTLTKSSALKKNMTGVIWLQHSTATQPLQITHQTHTHTRAGIS